MLKSRLLHPLLLCLYPVLLIYSENLDQIKPDNLLVPVFVCLGACTALACFFRLFCSRLENVTLLTSTYIFLFFSYGAFEKALNLGRSQPEFLHYLQPGFWGLALIVLPFLILHPKTDPGPVATQFVNVIALSLMLMLGFNISTAWLSGKTHGRKAAVPTQTSTPLQAVARPDIYFIILDGYGRADILKELYSYDNGPFIEELRQLGFRVIDRSVANYCQTYLSLSSILNMKYHDDLWQEKYEHNSVSPLIEMIADNSVFKMLKDQGYQTVALESGYSGTELVSADHYLARNLLNTEFINILINTTYLAAFRSSYFDTAKMQIEAHRSRINETFNRIPQVHSLPNLRQQPFILFSHIASPHPPFVFNEDGSLQENVGNFGLEDGNHWKNKLQNYKESYVNQLKFVNRKSLKMVRELLQNSPRQKIIILQSDHGPGSQLDWRSRENTNVRERLAILNAIYFDDGDYSAIKDDHTPVNTFRVIFNKYFKAGMQLHENRSHYSRWIGRYMFVDVTGEVLPEPAAD